MTHLRERLQAGDPARTARPLDAGEMAAIHRAMAAVQPEPRRWPIAAGFALAAAVLVAAVLLWPRTKPAPMPVATTPPAPEVQVPPPPVPVVAEVRPSRPRKEVPPPAPPAGPAQVKEIRFVTASGTQILWTVRSSEEGA
ncbi:MAG TPA: hypothetical protein VFO11_09550 [Candidatus Polarisedimenticolaceae bacterium]|nr:hypothetical protein [Candidatus Polarisedimenticolaceae bacterium]